MTAITDLVTSGPAVPDGWIAEPWTIDAAHTTVSFTVRHLMSRVRGTFSEVSGQVITHPDLSESTVAATIAVASISTGNEMRDNHLRSADFFDRTIPSDVFHQHRAAPGGRLVAGVR